MARLDPGYNPNIELTQVTASPNIQTVQAGNDPRSSSAVRLAEALGVAMPAAAQLAKVQTDIEKDKATAYANSMSLSELDAKIKNKELMASQSPVFAATLHHIWAQNNRVQLVEDTAAKISSGQLRFDNDPDGTPNGKTAQQKLDEYLTGSRNNILQGANEYAIHGFDSEWGQARESLLALNAKVSNKRLLEEASIQGNSNLYVEYTQAKQAGESPESIVSRLRNRFDLLKSTSVLSTPDLQRDALRSLVDTVASSGDLDTVKILLDSQIEGERTVRDLVSPERAALYQNKAEAQFDQDKRKQVDYELDPFKVAARNGDLDVEALNKYYQANHRWMSSDTHASLLAMNDAAKERLSREADRIRLLSMASQSLRNAQALVDSQLEQGKFALSGRENEQITVVTPSGEVRKFDYKDYATQKLLKETDGSPSAKNVQLWSANGLDNPAWQQALRDGFNNVASVGWSNDGKAVGQLNEAGLKTISLYRNLASVDAGYADKLAGDKAETLRNIDVMMTLGGYSDPNAAAAVVNEAKRRSADGMYASGIRQKVATAVDGVVNPSFLSSKIQSIKSWWNNENEQVNLSQVRGQLSTVAETLLLAGAAGDEDDAVNKAAKYLSNSAVTAKVNNTVYLRSQLPPAPANQDSAALFEKFIQLIPGGIAKSRGIDTQDVTLVRQKGGWYIAYAGGFPMHGSDAQHYLTFTEGQITKWYQDYLDQQKRLGTSKKGKLDKMQEAINVAPWTKAFSNSPNNLTKPK